MDKELIIIPGSRALPRARELKHPQYLSGEYGSAVAPSHGRVS